MPKEKVSYWTKRRRLQQAVSQHIQMIESLQSSHGHNTDQNDEQGSLIHAAGVGASNACSSSDISNTPCNISVPDSSMRWQEESGESSENELNTCMGTSERVGNVSESDLSCEEDSDLGIAGNIAAWAVDFDISHAALNSLLATLQEYHPNLPNDSRTLLKTIRTVSTQNLAGGSYYHFGLQNGMVSKLQLCNPGSNLTVQINIDGLPLFKSSSLQLWPILGLLDQAEDKEPFVIGLFCGKTKPDSCESFLQPLIEELKLIETDGILHNGKSYSVKVSAVICDAPARSFVKCVKGHSGYHGCERCIQEGEYVGKMTFPETEAALRTDKSFKDRRDEDHHLAISPFENTSVGMVTQFPLDYMHLVCLGVVKRMLLLWKKGPFLTSVSKTLINMRNLIPMEFSRKTRSVEEVGRWKATEFRSFLLCTGPVVLNGRFPEVLFKNFLLLSIGIRILLSPSLSSVYVGYAHELLVLFVNHWGELYGKDQLVYNVHCLVHLADDVKRYGPLDRVSAFPFENFLGKLKRMVRKPEHPLQQIVRRLSEKDGAVSKEEKILWKSHANGPLPLHFGVCEQFSYATVNGFTVGIREGDNVVKISDDICIVHNIILTDSQNMNYLVVEFVEEKEVDVVSECWMAGKDTCHWPPVRCSSKIARAVQSHQSPDSSWPTFLVRVLYEADTYDKARQKLPTAEDTSDIQTNDERETQPPKRRRIVNRRYLSEDSDDDDVVPLRRSPRKVASSPKKTTLPRLPSTPAFVPSPQSIRQSPTPVSASSPQFSRSGSRSSEASVSPAEKQMLLILEGIKARQEEILTEVKAAQNKIEMVIAQLPGVTNASSSENMDTELGLPVSTPEELDALDQELRQDETLAKKLVSFLSLIGGRKVDDCVRRIMTACLTNSLAKKYNWVGRCGKIAFSKLHLCTLIYQSVQKNPLFRKASKSEVEEVQKSWLRFALDRDGGRKRRKENEDEADQ